MDEAAVLPFGGLCAGGPIRECAEFFRSQMACAGFVLNTQGFEKRERKSFLPHHLFARKA
ncbi:MAG: hypothetical protein IJ746_02050 [Ruminococcus sp.]|nr:hypothetical protein [Ruminococcus sp.]